MLELSDKHFKGAMITIVNEVKENMLIMNGRKRKLKKWNRNYKKINEILKLKNIVFGEKTEWTQEQNGKKEKVSEHEERSIEILQCKQGREQRTENKMSRALGIRGATSKDLTHR